MFSGFAQSKKKEMENVSGHSKRFLNHRTELRLGDEVDDMLCDEEDYDLPSEEEEDNSKFSLRQPLVLPLSDFAKPAVNPFRSRIR